jgi:hypothetical protein
MNKYNLEILIVWESYAEVELHSELNQTDLESLLLTSIASHIYIKKSLQWLEDFIEPIISNTSKLFSLMSQDIDAKTIELAKKVVTIKFNS